MNNYTLNLIVEKQKTDEVLERVSIYQNEFYEMEVIFGVVTKVPLRVNIYHNPYYEFLPDLIARLHEGRWECLINYTEILIKEATSDELAKFIQECQHGEVTANVIVEMLNSLDFYNQCKTKNELVC